jgi:hypothetical protein
MKSAKMCKDLTFTTTTLGDAFPTYNASSEEEKRMKRSSPFYLVIKNELERAEFLKAGIDLPKGKIVGGGEFVRFDIGEDDPQFESFARVLQKRVIDDSSAHATRENVHIPMQPKALGAGNSEWLDGYSGQTVEELLALEGKYRIASLSSGIRASCSAKGRAE